MLKKNMINHLTGVQKLFEVGIIISFFIAVFISISLFSFSPVDPSWSQQQWVAEIENAGGRAGAWIADILFYALGLLAYFVPLAIVFLAWILFWKPKFRLDIDFLNLGLRIIGFIFTLVSTSAIASLNFNDFHYYPSGGLIGDVVAQSMLGFFSLLAVNLILLTLLISGSTLLLGISWLRFIDNLGATVIALFTWLYLLPSKIKAWQARRKNEKAQAVEEVQELPAVAATETKLQNSSSPAKRQTTITAEPDTPLPQADEFADLDFADLEMDEPYDDALFDLDSKFAESDDERIDFTEPPETESLEPLAAMPAVEPEPEVDFSHLPEHAKPVIKRKIDSDLAPFPSIELLDRADKKHKPVSQEELDAAARLVESKLLEFKIKAEVVNVLPGPVITRFELALSPGMKVSTVSSLEKDLARALSAMSVRVVDQIPGKSVIALELPNKHREIVYSSQVLGSPDFQDAKSPLSMVLGADISGEPVVVNLAKMPHLLVGWYYGLG